MSPRRVEACCVLTADGKTRPAKAAVPSAVRSWLDAVRGRCDAVVRPSSSDPAALLAALGRARGRRVMVEGGPDVLRGLVVAGLLTDLHAAILPVISGGASVPTLLGPAAASLRRHSAELRLQRFRVAAGAALVTYSLPRSEKTASARGGGRLKNRP